MFLGYLILIFPLTAVLSLLSYLPLYIYRRKTAGKRPFIRHLTVYACIGVVWSILFITIFLGGIPVEFPVGYHFLNLVPFVWVRETYAMGFDKMIEQLLMNVAMLIPLGIFLPAALSSMRKWWKVLFCIALFILCVETVQYFIGRSADVDDLIMNTFGGMIGYGIFQILDRCFGRQTWWQNAITP